MSYSKEVKMAELEATKTLFELRCLVGSQFQEEYTQALAEYANAVAQEHQLDVNIAILQKQISELHDTFLKYWEMCDNEIDIGELQQEYNSTIDEEIRLMDLLEALEHKQKEILFDHFSGTHRCLDKI